MGVPPPRFRPSRDQGWRHLAGYCNETMAELLLAGEQPGTFLLRKYKPRADAASPRPLPRASRGGPSDDGDSLFALSYVADTEIAELSAEGPQATLSALTEPEQHQLAQILERQRLRGQVVPRWDACDSDDDAPDAEAAAGSSVVHALLRCAPGSFEYCYAIAGAQDPKLVERSHDLMETFSSLDELLAEFDGIATHGFNYAPDDYDEVASTAVTPPIPAALPLAADPAGARAEEAVHPAGGGGSGTAPELSTVAPPVGQPGTGASDVLGGGTHSDPALQHSSPLEPETWTQPAGAASSSSALPSCTEEGARKDGEHVALLLPSRSSAQAQEGDSTVTPATAAPLPLAAAPLLGDDASAGVLGQPAVGETAGEEEEAAAAAAAAAPSPAAAAAETAAVETATAAAEDSSPLPDSAADNGDAAYDCAPTLETDLYEEQQRHVLLIDLQAAIGRVEDYLERWKEQARAGALKRKKPVPPWESPEGISVSSSVVCALDAVFCHGFRLGEKQQNHVTFFMKNWQQRAKSAVAAAEEPRASVTRSLSLAVGTEGGGPRGSRVDDYFGAPASSEAVAEAQAKQAAQAVQVAEEEVGWKGQRGKRGCEASTRRVWRATTGQAGSAVSRHMA